MLETIWFGLQRSEGTAGHRITVTESCVRVARIGEIHQTVSSSRTVVRRWLSSTAHLILIPDLNLGNFGMEAKASYEYQLPTRILWGYLYPASASALPVCPCPRRVVGENLATIASVAVNPRRRIDLRCTSFGGTKRLISVATPRTPASRHLTPSANNGGSGCDPG